MSIFKNRKFMYLILGLVVVLITSLTMAYAILSVTLNIQGNAELVGSNWDIHFANPVVTVGSSTQSIPTIKGDELIVTTSLYLPGDFYEFTVDVVNAGSIDAIIESIEESCDITEEQLKYVSLDIKYSNGGSIDTMNFLKAGTNRTIKGRISYRTDIESTDLPKTTTTINFLFKINYSQVSSDVINDGITDIEGDVNVNTYIYATGESFNGIPGMSLYDCINLKYEEMKVTGGGSYPRATEFTVYDMDMDQVMVDENGKIINLINTIIEAGKTYEATFYNVGSKIDDDDFRNDNYVTTGIEVTNIIQASLTGEEFSFIPVFVEPGDSYVNVAHAVYPDGYFFANAAKVEALEQEVIDDYILGIHSGQKVGCEGTSVHRFFAFVDENNAPTKITDEVNHMDTRFGILYTIEESEMTYDEAKAHVREQLLG